MTARVRTGVNWREARHAVAPSSSDGFRKDGHGSSGGIGNHPGTTTGGREAAPVALCAWCAPLDEQPNATHVMCDRCRPRFLREVAAGLLTVASAPALWFFGALVQEITR